VARPPQYFGTDLVINPAVSHRAARALRRAYERHSLLEYGKVWEPEERAFDFQTQFQLWLGFLLVSGTWAGVFITPAILHAQGYLTVDQAVGSFLVPGLIVFAVFTLATLPAPWKTVLLTFGGMIVWPVTFPVLLIKIHRRWPDRYAERYHRRYVVPATDFDEAAVALWARATQTGTALAAPTGPDADKAAARRMWAIAELLARSSLPSEPDQRSALLDDATRQIDLIRQ
jgi:hypothetical protein